MESLGLQDAFVNFFKTGRKLRGIPEERFESWRKNKPKPPSSVVGIEEHTFFQNLGQELGIAPIQAIRSYFVAGIPQLQAEDALLVDFVLALGAEEGRTYKRYLEDRREQVYPFWTQALQDNGSFGEDDLPSENTMRQQYEEAALRRFAERLDQPTARHLQSLGLDQSAIKRLVGTDSPEAGPEEFVEVTVLGAAVMDLLFEVPAVPGQDSSVQAHEFSEFPGGKGLTQAVALSRLGLKSHLIAAVGMAGGDHGRGHEVVRYLKSQEVGVKGLLPVENEECPVTLVLTEPDGWSRAVGWKNERRVAIDDRYITQSADVQTLISRSRVAYASFEPPMDAVEAFIELAKEDADRLVVVSPSPPVEGRGLDGGLLSKIDFLVANAEELTALSRVRRPGPSPGDVTWDPEAEARRLVHGGVRHVCLIAPGASKVYFLEEDGSVGVLTAATSGGLLTRETAGARDAFAAMLAYGLLHGETLQTAVDRATEAGEHAYSRRGVPKSMPYLEELRGRTRSDL